MMVAPAPATTSLDDNNINDNNDRMMNDGESSQEMVREEKQEPQEGPRSSTAAAAAAVAGDEAEGPRKLKSSRGDTNHKKKRMGSSSASRKSTSTTSARRNQDQEEHGDLNSSTEKNSVEKGAPLSATTSASSVGDSQEKMKKTSAPKKTMRRSKSFLDQPATITTNNYNGLDVSTAGSSAAGSSTSDRKQKKKKSSRSSRKKLMDASSTQKSSSRRHVGGMAGQSERVGSSRRVMIGGASERYSLTDTSDRRRQLMMSVSHKAQSERLDSSSIAASHNHVHSSRRRMTSGSQHQPHRLRSSSSTRALKANERPVSSRHLVQGKSRRSNSGRSTTKPVPSTANGTPEDDDGDDTLPALTPPPAAQSANDADMDKASAKEENSLFDKEVDTTSDMMNTNSNPPREEMIRTRTEQLQSFLDQAVLLRAKTNPEIPEHAELRLTLSYFIEDVSHALATQPDHDQDEEDHDSVVTAAAAVLEAAAAVVHETTTPTEATTQRRTRLDVARALEQATLLYLQVSTESNKLQMETLAHDYQAMLQHGDAAIDGDDQDVEQALQSLASFQQRLEDILRDIPEATVEVVEPVANKEVVEPEATKNGVASPTTTTTVPRTPQVLEIPQFPHGIKPDPVVLQGLLDSATLLFAAAPCNHDVQDLVEEIGHVLYYATHDDDETAVTSPPNNNKYSTPVSSSSSSPSSTGARTTAIIAHELEAALLHHMEVGDDASNEVLQALAKEYESVKALELEADMSAATTTEILEPVEMEGQVAAESVVASLRDRLDTDHYLARPHQTLNFLGDWFTLHIDHSDRRFVEFRRDA